MWMKTENKIYLYWCENTKTKDSYNFMSTNKMPIGKIIKDDNASYIIKDRAEETKEKYEQY